MYGIKDPDLSLKETLWCDTAVIVKAWVDEQQRVRPIQPGELQVVSPDGTVLGDLLAWCGSALGDPHTLCGSPRCSLGEGHTVSCDELAQPPA